jgi:NAD-dependent deacetylase
MTFITVVSGSGISAASGIATYRSDPGWDEYARGIAHASRYGNHLPELWRHWTTMARTISSAEPNLAHIALAAAGAKIITQNVDGLHQRAGSEDVIELHGNMRTMRCLRCKKTSDCDLSTESPVCAHCGSARVRTNAVLFGEQLLSRNVKTAMDWINSSPVILVIGTSGEVHPARGFVDLALQRTLQGSAKTVLFDISEWPDKPAFSEIVLGPAEQTLPVYLWHFLAQQQLKH